MFSTGESCAYEPLFQQTKWSLNSGVELLLFSEIYCEGAGELFLLSVESCIVKARVPKVACL